MNKLPTLENPYAVLGIKRDAGEAEIKQAYFAKVREHSPEHDPEGFKRIRAAYDKIRSAKTRAETDLFLVESPTLADLLAQFSRTSVPLPELTPELIKADLLAMETTLIYEEVVTSLQ